MVDGYGEAISSEIGPVSVTITAAATTSMTLDFYATSGTTGSLEVDWTVASTTSSAQCDVHGASDVAIQLYDASGVAYGLVRYVTCSSFTTIFACLPPGTYGVSGQMVDANGDPVSTSIPPVTVVVSAGATSVQRFDFPSDSFTS